MSVMKGLYCGGFLMLFITVNVLKHTEAGKVGNIETIYVHASTAWPEILVGIKFGRVGPNCDYK